MQIMQKETLWPRQVCATNRKCSDRRRGIWNLRSNERMFRLRYQFWHICHGTTSVTDRVHVKWKSFFFFFLLWHMFFWPESAGIYIYISLINNLLGKTLLFFLNCLCLVPPPPLPSLFAMVHPFKRWLRTNLYLHFRGSDYKHDVAFKLE